MLFTLPPGATAGSDPTAPAFWEPTEATFTDEHGNTYQWSSRAHRKGRYPVVVSSPYSRHGSYLPRLAPIWLGYPFADLSYWVALVFTLGCVAWVINGHYALYDVGAAVATDTKQAATVVTAAAFVGGTLFEIGSWLLYWEALNQQPDIQTGKQLQQQQQQQQQQDQDSCNGNSNTANGRANNRAVVPTFDLEANSTDTHCGGRNQRQQQQHLQLPAAQYILCPVANECPKLLRQRLERAARLHNLGQQGSVLVIHVSQQQQQQQQQQQLNKQQDQQQKGQQWTKPDKSQAVLKPAPVCRTKYQQEWIWFGLRFRDVGFTASLLQLIGATVFWVPCIFGIANVYATETVANHRVWNGVFWGLQMAGASFFIISALAFMIEEQHRWYVPAPLKIGWHVGFWNLIGAVGFFLSGAFGLYAVPQERYQIGGMAGSTFWGSYAFLIGSYLQLLEAVNKHPDSLQWLPTNWQSGKGA